MTVQVNISDAKANLSRLLEQVQAGERVIISKAGKPIADLVRHQGSTIRFGGLKDQIVYDEAAFDVDPELNAMFYGDDAAS